MLGQMKIKKDKNGKYIILVCNSDLKSDFKNNEWMHEANFEDDILLFEEEFKKYNGKKGEKYIDDFLEFVGRPSERTEIYFETYTDAKKFKNECNDKLLAQKIMKILNNES